MIILQTSRVIKVSSSVNITNLEICTSDFHRNMYMMQLKVLKASILTASSSLWNLGVHYSDLLSLVWGSDWQLEGGRGEGVCGRIQVCSLSGAPKTEIKVSSKFTCWRNPVPCRRRSEASVLLLVIIGQGHSQLPQAAHSSFPCGHS